MSDLTKIIEINKNIEKQNEEIIRLLKIIAGETSDVGEIEDETPQELMIENPLGVGEVYFIDEFELFKLSLKNNEMTIDNLTGDSESSDFDAALSVVNESVEKNHSLDESICILNDSSKGRLPDAIKLIIDNGGKKAFIPWDQTMELMGAPQELRFLIKLDLYRSKEDLIKKIFGESND